MKDKTKRRVILIVIVSLVLAFFFSGFSLGKEMSKIETKANSKIAKPIIKIENNETLSIDNRNKEGVYDFKIKNYDENEIVTEVDMEYYIEILTQLDKAITFKLYKNNEEIPICDNKTNIYYLSNDKKQEDNYRIEIKYNKLDSNPSSDIFQDIQIKVHSEQRKA